MIKLRYLLLLLIFSCNNEPELTKKDVTKNELYIAEILTQDYSVVTNIVTNIETNEYIREVVTISAEDWHEYTNECREIDESDKIHKFIYKDMALYGRDRTGWSFGTNYKFFDRFTNSHHIGEKVDTSGWKWESLTNKGW